MTKKILIDASHAEETRVVVLDGNRLEDFDVETATRRQIKGNIYLAKVIRVEPSLQAAFVEYGGNRHGFLAFGEIHPDYYQIPVADRQRLLAMQAEDAQAADQAEEAEASRDAPPELRASPLEIESIGIIAAPPPDEAFEPSPEAILEPSPEAIFEPSPEAIFEPSPEAIFEPSPEAPAAAGGEETAPAGFDDSPVDENAADATGDENAADATGDENAADATGDENAADATGDENAADAAGDENAADAAGPDALYTPPEPPPESLGGDGDDAAEARERRQRQRFLRNYKIQEVIHRRQIMLIQVVKEERGNKGAALTTYLSLAGRFSVLMPNSPSGGGVSRKITSLADRRRLKEAMAELDVPQGMGLIVRTAGANRPKPEIKRDCEYLLRLWDDIRDRTMASTAPALIYEEASLIKRSIRDVYTRDVDDIFVDGEEGYRAAYDFMRMLMPSHGKKVQLWTEGQPLFAKFQVEAQLDAMLNPIVQLRSGGYIVINQTEALVAIDVNSGRSTRERSIEDTALRTNMEAAEEVARQLRMRDLAGLIVIDFIDMESRKNNASVERRLKDSLKNDRARIQVGSISHFGLMEMSRQRLRPSVAEASLIACPHCAGIGHVRSPESAALHILRAIEDEGAKFRAAEILVTLPPEVALYLFNHKRDRLSSIETRYAMQIVFSGDAGLAAANFRIEKTRAQTGTLPARVTPAQSPAPEPPADAPDEEADEADAGQAAGTAETAEESGRRRRRRRRGKRRPETGNAPGLETGNAPGLETGNAPALETGNAPALESPDAPAEPDAQAAQPPSEMDLVLAAELGEFEASGGAPEAETDAKPARRRRVRGGRRRTGEPADEALAEPAPEPVYADVADIFEAAERAEAAQRVKAHIVIEASPPEPALEPALEPAAAAPEAAPEPFVKPVVIGASEEPAEKKRGWWRR